MCFFLEGEHTEQSSLVANANVIPGRLAAVILSSISDVGARCNVRRMRCVRGLETGSSWGSAGRDPLRLVSEDHVAQVKETCMSSDQMQSAVIWIWWFDATCADVQCTNAAMPGLFFPPSFCYTCVLVQCQAWKEISMRTPDRVCTTCVHPLVCWIVVLFVPGSTVFAALSVGVAETSFSTIFELGASITSGGRVRCTTCVL
jgi:hypothetical protein